MPEYNYKTVRGCERRIRIIEERMADFKKLRGVGPGTFYLDLKAVDLSIKEMKKEIKALKNKIVILESEDPSLIKELSLIQQFRESEIF